MLHTLCVYGEVRGLTAGLATREIWPLTNERKMGKDMIASNYEGTAPTGQTSAQGIPIPGSPLVVGAVPFLFGEAAA